METGSIALFFGRANGPCDWTHFLLASMDNSWAVSPLPGWGGRGCRGKGYNPA